MNGRTTLSAMLCLCMAGTALAQTVDPAPIQITPQSVARHCLERMNQLLAHFARFTRAQTTECVAGIERLLDEEKPEEAAQLARRCIASINAKARRTTQRIQNTAHRCIETLVDMDAPPELIARVRSAAIDKVERVGEIRQAAVERIESALEGQ